MAVVQKCFLLHCCCCRSSTIQWMSKCASIWKVTLPNRYSLSDSKKWIGSSEVRIRTGVCKMCLLASWIFPEETFEWMDVKTDTGKIWVKFIQSNFQQRSWGHVNYKVGYTNKLLWNISFWRQNIKFFGI